MGLKEERVFGGEQTFRKPQKTGVRTPLMAIWAFVLLFLLNELAAELG